jgi:hypothetical protein
MSQFLKETDGAKQSEGSQDAQKKKKAKTALIKDDPVIEALNEEFIEHQGPGWESLAYVQKVCATRCFLRSVIEHDMHAYVFCMMRCRIFSLKARLQWQKSFVLTGWNSSPFWRTSRTRPFLLIP